MSSKDNSLIEIAVELLQKKQRPQNINSIIKEVMSIKGIKAAEVSNYAPQFVMDFMLSGYFVYCGEDCWDLKDRQPTSVLDKDGGDFEDFLANDEDVKKNELKDGAFGAAYTDENNYGYIQALIRQNALLQKQLASLEEKITMLDMKINYLLDNPKH